MSKTFDGKPCPRCGGVTRYHCNRSCVSCTYARNARWAAENQERHRENGRRWAENNREKEHERYRRWQANNPAAVTAKVAKRRAAKLHRTPPWADLSAIRAIYAERERIEAATGIPHHVDHIIPLRGTHVSGLHIAANLRVIPAAENLAKGNRL